MEKAAATKRILFVDDEPNILTGLQRLLRSHRHEWEMVFVNSAEEALARLEQETFHIIVSDLRMPRINGAQLLCKVQQRYPDVARFILSGHANTDMILQSVSAAHQFLAKPCDADKLQEAITRAFSLRDIFNSQTLLNIVRNASTLPTLPDLYNELTEALQSSNSSAERIAKIISQDVMMSAKVLQLVNSAFFGLSRKVDSIGQAVALLGAEIINNVVLTTGVFGTYDQAMVETYEIREIYAHSLRVANFSARLAKAILKDKKATEEAMLAGMLHDLGKLALINSGNEIWSQLYLNRKKETRPLHLLEREALGITHAEIGAYLLGLWGLNNQVAEAVAFHHNPIDAPTKEFGTMALLHMADVLEINSHQRLYGFTQVDMDYLAAIGFDDRLDECAAYCAVDLENETTADGKDA
jgi:putative nucleotidyltransferase with HDIG domain